VSRNMGRLPTGDEITLLLATGGCSCEVRIVALVTERWVRALWARRVQEGHKYALLHELVDFGDSFV